MCCKWYKSQCTSQFSIIISEYFQFTRFLSNFHNQIQNILEKKSRMCRLIFVSLLAILSAYVHFSEACVRVWYFHICCMYHWIPIFSLFIQNGYKMRLISVDNCSDGEHVLEVDKNFTSKLSEDCFVTNHGCITSKGFSTAKVGTLVLIY